MSRLHAYVGSIRQLEILLAVHDHGSINGAAKALHLTQPTVSMQMKKLSEAIDSPLYEIQSKQLYFTDQGLELVKTAVEVLDSFARLDHKLNAMRELQTGTLRLAVVNTSQYFIPHLLGPFCERYPGVDIQLKVGNREATLERLKRGVDDFYVFSHPPSDSDTQSIEFFDNPLVAFANSKHPLTKKKSLSIQQLLKEPFLIREQGSGTRYALETFLRQHNIALNVRMTIEGNEAIKHAVMSGLGISILSQHTLTFGGDHGLVQLPVKELPIHSRWFFVWSNAKRQTLIATEFLEYVENDGRAVLQQFV